MVVYHGFHKNIKQQKLFQHSKQETFPNQHVTLKTGVMIILINLIPWRGSQCGNMTVKMEDFGTFVTAEQFSSVLAHRAPVFIGVFVCFWGLL